MTTREQHRTAAAIRHDLERAVVAIVRRGGDPEVLFTEIWAAVTGRYDLREKQATGAVPLRCGRPLPDGHPGTALVGGCCPICQWRPTT
jgi:hypothetical protein